MPRRFGPQDFPIQHHSWAPEIFHVVMTIALLAAIVALVVWIVNSTRRPVASVAPQPTGADTALNEARMRYVRGEIDRETFLQITGDLGGSQPTIDS
jgi:uncharacterized membrane protein